MNPVNPLTGNFDGVRYYRGVVEGSDPRRNSTALLSHPFINEAADVVTLSFLIYNSMYPYSELSRTEGPASKSM